MAQKKTNWVYITAFFLLLLLIFLGVFASYKEEIHLPLPLYFFLLVICDLAATAFLSGALKSTASYDGNIAKGNLKLTGPVVIFLLILYAGYRFRPVPASSPFDLTFIVSTPSSSMQPLKGDIRIELDNNPRKQSIDDENKAVFTNIDARYNGKNIPVSIQIPNYKLVTGADTTVTIASAQLPTVRIKMVPANDSALFAGYVLVRNPGKRSKPLPDACIDFTGFDKKVYPDSAGNFKVYLPGKTGTTADITILQKNKFVSNQQITLSNNIEIYVNE